MDLWVALAAAGAGYVAKNWKNFDKENENSSDSSIGDPKILEPQLPTLFRRLVRRKRFEEDNLNRFDSEVNMGSMPFGHLKNEINHGISEEFGINEESGENSENLNNESLIGEFCVRYDPKRHRSSLRSRRPNLRMMKPLTSLDNCLLAQLYNENAQMDEYILSCLPSPFIRPFVVTDGKRVIGREGDNSLNSHSKTRKFRLHNQVNLAENEVVSGIPSLSHDMFLERNTKARGLGGRLTSSVARRKHSNSLAGSTNGPLLFGLGVSVGLIFSFLANKRDVDKLNGLLNQTQNLVQDLQEELEMKDSLTVKELPNEDLESHDTNYESYDKRALQSFSPRNDLDGLTVEKGKKNENLESMSKIEAELEAELERLELNMSSSSLERRLSDLAESDPNFEAGVSQGELRPEMFGALISDQPYADQDGSGSSTLHPTNYSVSPHELTLRLHELIQTRLEKRVKELENALEKALEASKKKVQAMVTRNQSDSESISSPVAIEEQNLVDQPVIINLSGDALDAYNEACDELNNANEYDECVSHNDYNNTLNWRISSGDDIGCSGTESESDDEFEKLLIKQIVEKNRRNSSAILNVERELFADKCEQ